MKIKIKKITKIAKQWGQSGYKKITFGKKNCAKISDVCERKIEKIANKSENFITIRANCSADCRHD